MGRPADAAGQSHRLQEVLREVSESFVSGFEGQIEILDRFYEAILTSGVGADASEAHSVAHRICGIARTLGFTGIGDAAATLEEATERDAWRRGQFESAFVLTCLEKIISEMEAARSPKHDADGSIASC